LPWMAPEIIEQLPPTTAADIFSYQVVMFELITGQLPHAERSPQMIVKFMSRNKRLPLPNDDFTPQEVCVYITFV
jgi:serine/threonine protein kinase